MTTATVRITTSTREQLRELAEQTGKSMQALMAEAVAAYRRRVPSEGRQAAGRRGEVGHGQEKLAASAELYTEVYSEDEDLRSLTDAALSGWPEIPRLQPQSP
jgi:predicted transcriptional regulator